MVVRTARTLRVALAGVEVGYLTWFSDARGIFQFADSYQAMGPTRPIFSLSFTEPGDETRTRQKLAQAYTRTVRLPPFFRNLLPEGALRERMARLLGTSTEDEFGLLEGLGSNLPGAVTAQKDSTPSNIANFTISQPLAAADSTQKELFSLGGAQLKTVMLKSEGKFVTRTSPQQLGEEWIIKPPHPVYAKVPENEYWMMKFAALIGIETPNVELVHINDLDFGDDSVGYLARGETFAYAVKRFDRNGESRIHIEDFAQVFGVDPENEYKATNYDSIGNLIFKVFPDPYDQLAEFVRRVVFMILIGNSDAHLKNWSVIYRDVRSPTLSPAYDLLATIQYVKENKTLALNIRGERRFSHLAFDHLARMARRIGVSPDFVTTQAKKTVDAARQTWPDLKRGLPAHLADLLQEYWRELTDDFRVA